MVTELRRGPSQARSFALSHAIWFELLAVLAVFLVALVLRVYRLQEWPPGLFSDEAAYGLDALSVLDGARPIFFPRNTGREPLFPYLEAGMMALLGPTPYALRLTAALLGSLAVPAAYWMVRELFWGSPLGARSVALWSALFMAFGYWHISLNRIAFRANMLPLLAAVTFALFWRAWRTVLQGTRFPWLWLILSGVALGLTLYTYTASRFMPILLALMVLATVLKPGLDRRMRLRACGALGVIALTSAIVFAPLGWYFVQHPDLFVGRAASISIFSEEFAGDGPVQALLASLGKFALMFLAAGDPNLRHNPGQRPVFDLLLGLWFYAGLALCLLRWRNLPYLFLAAWTLLLALPAILTAEAAPHSLRAVGMIPAVYVLPVLAMLATGMWLGKHLGSPHWRRWALWLPLPFLIISAVTSVQSYFGAWRDIGSFNADFMTNYVELAGDIARTDEQGVWLLPLSPNYFLTEATFSTVDFLTANKADYAGITVDPDVVGAQLAAAAPGPSLVNLIRTDSNARFPEAAYILGDPKHLIKFVLDKYGVQVAERDDTLLGMPYLVYQLPARADFSAFGLEQPLAANFDGKLSLTAAGFGRTAQGSGTVDVNSAQVPAGEPLWVTLRWRADTPLDFDLKTSLTLRTPDGQIAGRVDDLLVSDRYPVERVWEPGEAAATYHILPTFPGVAPGRYDLVLRVYEDQSQRPYPILGAEGSPAAIDQVIGNVELVPAVSPQIVTPQQPLAAADVAAPQLAPGLALLGFDLPTASVAPGGTLPLTLYWQALAAPSVDYTVSLQLRTPDGKIAAEQTQPVTGGVYPTSRWLPGTTIRDWQDLTIAADVPNGSYAVWVALQEGMQRHEELLLGDITVEGRPRLFALPTMVPPENGAVLGATFADAVRLAGFEGALPHSVTAGAPLELPLVWQVLQNETRSLVRFVHLLGADGRPIAQTDSVPCSGACPSATWLTDEILRDTATLTVPADTPIGQYMLAVGWYDADTLGRLEARDATGAPLSDGLLRLAPLEVTAP